MNTCALPYETTLLTDDLLCEDCGMLMYEEEVVIYRNSRLCLSCAQNSVNHELDGAKAKLTLEEHP